MLLAYEKKCKELNKVRLSLEESHQVMVDFWTPLLEDGQDFHYTTLPEEECECPECEGTGKDTYIIDSFSGEDLLDIIKKIRG